MNELLFFIQILVVLGLTLTAKRLGKSALVAWISMQAIIANLFVLKQISLFGFEVTASDAYLIGSLLGLNLIQEQHGKGEAQKATWTCFFLMVFFTLISQVHLLFTPSEHDTMQNAYTKILSEAPRLTAASMSVFFLVQQFDIRFFNFLKTTFSSLKFPMRVGISLIVSQAIDTVLFGFAGLYGIVASLLDVIVLSFAVKLVVILTNTSILQWQRK